MSDAEREAVRILAGAVPDLVAVYRFGSTSSGTAGPESDVDLLVEFEPGHTPGMMGVSRLQRELEALLGGGRNVDLRTYGDLSRYFRDEVRATARPVFDAAA